MDHSKKHLKKKSVDAFFRPFFLAQLAPARINTCAKAKLVQPKAQHVQSTGGGGHLGDDVSRERHLAAYFCCKKVHTLLLFGLDESEKSQHSNHHS